MVAFHRKGDVIALSLRPLNVPMSDSGKRQAPFPGARNLPVELNAGVPLLSRLTGGISEVAPPHSAPHFCM